ncbi:MAG TPA: 3',5'-cyclic-nucleotide phosphodiesterase [Burkholderiales bacterium]|nr:3',5'-cyclic-nucleotide phosphodiesterase [Burkholderiales bacterium]
MQLTILGCSGGIGADLRTTCLLLDEDILIDCGTGAGDIDLEGMKKIEHVFLTHSHLDHTAMLPMLADSAGGFRKRPLVVHALPETMAILKAHVFNSLIWPDYTIQPAPESPYIRFESIRCGQTFVTKGRKITALPAEHSVPALGYLLDSGKSSFAFSGDTTLCDAFWETLNDAENLRYLMVEATFLDGDVERAKISGHMTPSLLAEGFSRLKRPVEILITHMETGRDEATMSEVMASSAKYRPVQARRGSVFEF